jgi:hypothetical protein
MQQWGLEMRIIVLFLAMIMLFTGCAVHRGKCVNYLPADQKRIEAFYHCLKESKELQFSSVSYKGTGSSSGGTVTNLATFRTCMAYNGYSLRKMKWWEITFSVITFIPFGLLEVWYDGYADFY